MTAMNSLDQQDFEFLLGNAKAGKEAGLSHFNHLDHSVGILSYLRLASLIKNELAPGAKILDWGCGLGQMTYLLNRRGFDCCAYDVQLEFTALPDLPLTRNFKRTLGTHPTELPFEDSSFDAVLSCGALEHVDEFSEKGNERKSLDEIVRVLRKDGIFLIYQLPQKYSWQEAIVRRLRLGYAHPRRYSASEIENMLREHGLEVLKLKRSNLIPRNLTGLPQSIKIIYSKFSKLWLFLDEYLCKIPVLNQIAGALEITARKS
jgi:ubiquinone/menaquinone biosynthesis C-methylase UbiE